MKRADIEIGDRHILVPRWVIGLGVILILAAPAVWAVSEFEGDIRDYSDQNQQEALERSVTGCERTNEGLRAVLYDFLAAAVEARRSTGSATDLAAARSYEDLQERMREAVEDFPGEGHPADADCEAAFSADSPPPGN